MGLLIGSLLGAANSLLTGFSSNSSLKKFLSTMDKFGVLITSRYEAMFSAIPLATFFITEIGTPSMKLNTTNLYFDGKLVEIPQNFEYEHDFTITVINDASGYIYSALQAFVMSDTASNLVNSGFTLSIRAIGDNNHKGSTIMLNGVRIKSIGNLNYQNLGGDVLTFSVGCSAIDYAVTPGSTAKVAGVTNAIGNLIG